jgi:predicted DNA-binding transcriptional regulator YafY
VADAPSRVERLLNLLALLLDTRRPLTRDDIVSHVAGYPTDPTASRRAFERDKETLRALGVPLTVGPIEQGEPGEVGYRVRPDDYYLPDLGLTPDETAALRVAVSAVSLGEHAGEGALMKLGGAVEEAASPIASLPMVPGLADLFDAYRRRAVVTFDYRGERREVEPWAIASSRGRWYLVGHDRRRGARRAFRADRIEGEIVAGPPGAFDPPPDVRAHERLGDRPWTWGDGTPTAVRVLVDAGHTAAAELEVGDDARVEPRPDGAAVVTMPVVDRPAFRAWVLGFLEHAEVLGPPDVRAEVVAWLRAVEGAP